jgi:hypothetical protein
MGIPVAIVGKPMSGKSFSIKSFSAAEVLVFSALKGTLPFQGFKSYRIVSLKDTQTKDTRGLYSAIFEEFKHPSVKTYIIDDSQFLMSNIWAHASEKEQAYGKIYIDISKLWLDLLEAIRNILPDDTTVYFMHHVVGEDGELKMQTLGNAMEEKFQMNGNFDVMLLAYKTEGQNPEYRFKVLRQPEGMFPGLENQNNLKLWDAEIKKYYQ